MHESTTQCVCHSPLIPGFDKENSCDANPQYPILDFQTNFISGKRPSWKGTSVKQLWKIQLLSTKSMNRSRSIATDGPMHEKQSNCVFGEVDKYSLLTKTTKKISTPRKAGFLAGGASLWLNHAEFVMVALLSVAENIFQHFFDFWFEFFDQWFLICRCWCWELKAHGILLLPLPLLLLLSQRMLFFFTIAKYAKFVFWCQNGNIFRAEYEIGYPKSTPGLVLGRGGGTH